MGRTVAVGLMLVAMVVPHANAVLAETTDEAVFTMSREELETKYRITVVVTNGVIVPAILIGLPLSVVALSRTKWGRQASRRLMRHGNVSRRRILPPIPYATSNAHKAGILRGPFGLVASAYRKNPLGTLGWLGLVAALGALPGALWLSMSRF